MLLAINVNNTNIKFGVIDGEEIVGEWRQHTSAMRTGDEHAVWLTQLMQIEGIDPKSITDAIVASVVPNANFNLRRLCSRYFNCEPMFLGEPSVVYGIKIKGQGAGADRICNTVGASLLFPKTPVLVVDFGLAGTSATDAQLDADAARMLAATSTAVGHERAVVAARRALGDDGFVEVLPYL